MGSGLAIRGFAVFDLLPALKDRESLFAESLSTQRLGGVTLHSPLLPETAWRRLHTRFVVPLRQPASGVAEGAHMPRVVQHTKAVLQDRPCVSGQPVVKQAPIPALRSQF